MENLEDLAGDSIDQDTQDWFNYNRFSDNSLNY